MSDGARLTAAERPVTFAEPPEVSFDESRTDQASLTDAVLAQAVTPGSLFVETFRVLRAKVESIDERRRLRCIGVVAAGPGEGTTTAAMGLAVALTREGARRVLLLEAVLRKPVLENRLGLPPATGLADWLLEGARAPLPLRRIEPWGIFFLSGGAPYAEPAPLLESEGMARLLKTARRAFDFVVVDCPPLAPLADSLLIQDLLDGFLLVVRSRCTPRQLIVQAVSHLKPDRVQGVILNGDHEILGRYRSRGHPRQG